MSTSLTEEATEPDPDLARALHAARERGRARASQVLSGADMLDADQFARRTGATPGTLDAMRIAGHVIGLGGAEDGWRFPASQLDAKGQPFTVLSLLHDCLGTSWAVYRFLHQRHGALDGLTGRDALLRRRGADVISAAEGIARGDFT